MGSIIGAVNPAEEKNVESVVVEDAETLQRRNELQQSLEKLKELVEKLENQEKIHDKLMEALGITPERTNELGKIMGERLKDVKSNIEVMVLVNEVAASKEEAAFLGVGAGMYFASEE